MTIGTIAIWIVVTLSITMIIYTAYQLVRDECRHRRWEMRQRARRRHQVRNRRAVLRAAQRAATSCN